MLTRNQLHTLLFFCCLFFNAKLFSQCGYLPDNCSDACYLGELYAPTPCGGGGNTIGQVTNYFLTNKGALADSAEISGCAYPAADIWYSFKASATELVLTIKGTLSSTNVSLYQGTNCSNLLPLKCFSISGGNLSVTYSPVSPDSTYYLQMSGGTYFDQQNFKLSLSNNYQCNNCVQGEALTVSPPPVDGAYSPGQTVSFCFTVTDYNEGAAVDSNNLHGVVLSFGPGWDTTTLTPTYIPPSCAQAPGSHWGFYMRDSSTSTNTLTPKVYGPGFYYSSTNGRMGTLDTLPGNNYGDEGVHGFTCQPTFCWKITTKNVEPCSNFANLGVTVRTTGDSQTGSQSLPACTSDPVENFSALLFCCWPPNMSVTNTSCGLNNNGAAVATGNGSPPFQYVWTNDTGTIIATHTHIYGSDTISGLKHAQYFVTVSDSTGCTNYGIATIGINPLDTFNIQTTTISCYGTTPGNGTITLTPKYPLNGPYVYSLSNGNGPFSSNNLFANLPVGLDTIYAMSNYGCHDTVTAAITRPPVLVIDSAITTQVACNIGGTVTVYASGGTGSYNYTWSQGVTGNPATGLAADTYYLTLTDQNQCTDTASYTITNSQSAIKLGTPVINGVSCYGYSNGSIALDAMGFGPVRYSWSNGDTTASVRGLIHATYTVNITDSAGCRTHHQFLVPAPAQLIIDTAAYILPVSCSGAGSVYALITGGTTPYTYRWSGQQTTDTIADLSVGSYVLTVTDHNNCSASATYNVTSNVHTVSFNAPQIVSNSCYGYTDGSIAVSVTGGVGNITYSWSNQDSTATITGLSAGSYTVVAKDSNSCSVTAVYTVTQPLVLSPNLSYQHLLCYDSTSERLSVNPSGGTPGYSYLWSDSTTGSSIEHSLGKFEVTVTDSKNCFVIDSGFIAGMDSQIYNTNILTLYRCIYPGKGDLQLDGKGGTGYLTYTVSSAGSDTTGVFKGLAPGNYSFTIIDTNGCTQSSTVTIPPSIANDSFALMIISPACYGDNTGEIIITPENPGDGPFQYQVNDGGYQSDTIFNGLASGTYDVEAQNYIFGCTYNLNVVIQPALPLLLNTATDTIYTGPGIARLITLDTSTIQDLIYSWTPTTGLTCATCASSYLQVDSNTVYVVVVMDTLDNKNCSVSDTLVVIVSPPDTLVMPMAFTPNGDGRNDLFEPVPSVNYGVPTILSFKIYNRWGELVHNANEPWDGKFNGHDQPVGTYIYYIEVREIDPNNSSGGTRMLKQQGAVTLLR